MELYCGTSGFSFKEWKGPFYPEALPAERMLSFYAQRLPTVEINNTFYRMPRPNVLSGWAAKVPKTFLFAIKASRRISHSKKLAGCEQEAAFLFGALESLGTRLGAVLVQLPPTARVNVESLKSFLELVPEAVSIAFEFRHDSWRDESVFAALRSHGAAWVTTDDVGGTPPGLPETAAWTYLRLRAPAYTDEDLRAWKTRCADFDRAFVYFKHEQDGAGPKLAERMLGIF
jgi:uncharacterized protein YecE (DUF72 family)